MAGKAESKTESKTDGGAVDPALAAFASFIRSEEAEERAARKAAKAARAAEAEAGRLVKAKDDAAAHLKRLQSRSGVSAEERAAAEEAYRRALAAVVAAETGEAPTWAPPEAEDDTGSESVDAEATGDDTSGDDSPADGEATDDDEPIGGEATDDGAADGEAAVDADEATPSDG